MSISCLRLSSSVFIKYLNCKLPQAISINSNQSSTYYSSYSTTKLNQKLKSFAIDSRQSSIGNMQQELCQTSTQVSTANQVQIYIFGNKLAKELHWKGICQRNSRKNGQNLHVCLFGCQVEWFCEFSQFCWMETQLQHDCITLRCI